MVFNIQVYDKSGKLLAASVLKDCRGLAIPNVVNIWFGQNGINITGTLDGMIIITPVSPDLASSSADASA
jgi:hypothetical protein